MSAADVLALCEQWDSITKGESPTTKAIREALVKTDPSLVTVNVEDLTEVLNAVDYVTDRTLIGPVDRMGDAVALVRFKAGG